MRVRGGRRAGQDRTGQGGRRGQRAEGRGQSARERRRRLCVGIVAEAAWALGPGLGLRASVVGDSQVPLP